MSTKMQTSGKGRPLVRTVSLRVVGVKPPLYSQPLGQPCRGRIVGVMAWSQQVENYSARRTGRWFSGERPTPLLQLRVLRLGFLQDGDIGVGVFPGGLAGSCPVAAYPICKRGRPQGTSPLTLLAPFLPTTELGPDQFPLGQGFLFTTCRKSLNRKVGTPPAAG